MGGDRPFFEAPAPPPKQSVDHQRPRPWEEPIDIIGHEVPLELIVARSAAVVVVIGAMTAYPNGFAFNVSLLAKRGHELEPDGIRPWARRRGPTMEPAKELFHFGIEFADGSVVTNLQMMGIGAPHEPRPPILLGGGGGGGGNRFGFAYWVWPLPPPGPLWFVTEWSAESLPLSRFELNSDVILVAARSAKPIGLF
jgi:hypothetical protein